MRRSVVSLAACLLSILVHGLGANATWALGIPDDGIFGIDVRADVFNPGRPCQEKVHIEGVAHVVTDVRRVNGVAEVAVFITPDLEGVGALTGAQYVATGAVRQDVATPTLPASIPIQATFAFVPLGPCRLPSAQEEHLKIQLELAFDAAGNLASARTSFPTGAELSSGLD